jgi:CelD/BcsL family acetyltransferase involved in cellulose biosynthesis
MYHLERIDYAKDFLALRDEWNRLVVEQPNHTPFMYHEWFTYSYEARFRESEPFVLKIKQQTETIGYVPLCLFKSYLRNIVLRTVGFPDNPDIFTNSLICRHDPEHVFPAILQFFHSEFKEWDILLLDRIPDGYPLYHMVLPLAGRLRSKSFVLASGVNLILHLTQPWNDYYGHLTKNFRRSLRGIRNRLEQFGDAHFEMHTNHEGSIEAAFAELLQISSHCWKLETGVALPSQPASLAFFRMLTQGGLPDSEVIIYFLRINNIAAATELHIRANHTEYAFRADYHESYSRHSPGTFLDYNIIKHLYESGVQCYQLGPGLNPYKMKWEPTRQAVKEFIILNGTLKARLFCLLELNHRRAAHLAGTLSSLFASGGIRDTKPVDALG